jgi:nucleoid DNA-binding protein
MLDQLIALGKEQLSGQLQQQAGLQSNQVNQALDVTQNSLTSSLISQVAGGNVGQIMSLFNGQAAATASNPVVSGMITNLAGDLAAKVGINPQTAQTAANVIVPFIMQKFASSESGTANNEGDLLDKLGISGNDAIAGIAKSFLGNSGGGDLLGGLSKLFG